MRKKLKAKTVKPRCPPHYWLIDEKNVGRCNKPGYGCGAVKDFGKELKKASKKSFRFPPYVPKVKEKEYGDEFQT